MALACPQCGGAGQVLRLEAFWRSLGHDAEAKRDLACPAKYRAVWLWPVGGIALAVLLLRADDVPSGVVALLASLVLAVWMWRGYAEAEAARERWRAALYCRHCPEVFDPEEGKTV